MELESLKHIWNDLDVPPEPGPDRETLLALLQKRSGGPVARMRRNLRKEFLFILIFYIPAIIVYLVEFQGRLSAISLLLFLLAAFFCAYYYRKSRLLNKMQCVSCQVRSNLARQVATLKKYTRFYLVASTVSIPLTAIATYAIFHHFFYSDNQPVYHQLSPAPWWKNSIFWLILLVPFTVAIHYFNAWYINKLYGRHIKKLQELLREMDEE